jgi:hypothetical protein
MFSAVPAGMVTVTCCQVGAEVLLEVTQCCDPPMVMVVVPSVRVRVKLTVPDRQKL